MNLRAETSPIDEDARRRFESALAENSQTDFTDFLPPQTDARYRDTLEELALIDMEHRWKAYLLGDANDAQERPVLESYVDRFPQLQDGAVIRRMVAEECWMRKQYGDQPTEKDYITRFPQLTLPPELRELFVPERTADHPENRTERSGGERFDVLDEHARGGMGVVLRANDRRFNREVAVKRLAADLSTQQSSRLRFETEANISARLEHPGIVPVYDFGVDDSGCPFYAMKLVRGQTLTELIEVHHASGTRSDDWRIGSQRLLGILMSVARTVAFAHSRGVIHRDLKPDNIIVGDYGETVVVDWGLAKIRQSAESETTGESPEPIPQPLAVDEAPSYATLDGALMGTPMYMAPEQAEGRIQDIDERTDVYALGAMLYQILTGRPPFHSNQIKDLMNKICNEKPVRPRQIQPVADRPLEAVCLKSLHKAREDRYPTAEAFVEDLERFTANEPVVAFREPLWWKVGRWVSRHRTAVMVAGISLILISIGATLGFIQWDRARQDRLKQLAEQRAAAETVESSSRQAIQNGQWQLAKTQLDQALVTLGDDPDLETTRKRLIALRAPVTRLIQFRELANRAERVAFFDRDRDGMYLIERALKQLHVDQHWDWWDHLSPLDLASKDRDRLQQDVYRLQLVLTATRLKRGILESLTMSGMISRLTGAKNEKARYLFERAHQSAEAAHRFRHADATRIAMQFARSQLEDNVPLPDVSKLNPRNESDKYLIGLCLLFAHLFSDSPLAKPLLAMADLKEPLEEAKLLLTNASLFEPDYYWSAVWYGWAAEAAGQYDTAMVAYSRCIALRPNFSFSYINRAGALIEKAKKIKSSKRTWTTIMKHAVRDLRQAADLDPGDPDVAWKLAYCLNQIQGQYLAEINAMLQACLLEPPLSILPKAPRKTDLKGFLENSLRNGRNISKSVPQAIEPWLLRAFTALRLGSIDEAKSSLAKALEIEADSATAHLIAGELKLQEDERNSAREHFAKAVDREPGNFLARWGLARLAANDKEQLELYTRLTDYAGNDWQRVEALRGQAAALAKLNEGEKAGQVLKRAQDISPAFDASAILTVLEEKGSQEFVDAWRQELLDRKTTPPALKPTLGSFAPLLNGGFELSLARHWGLSSSSTTLRDIWFNVGDCQSTAKATVIDKHSGKMALRIDNSTPEGRNVFGATQQRLPVIPNATYRVRIWAKARNLGKKGFHVVINKSNNRIIRIDTGTYDWKLFEGTFKSTSSEATVRLRMRSTGTVWIDDLSMELVKQ